MSSFISFKNCGYTPNPESHNIKPMVGNLPLTKQSSIYALTFDELQNTMSGSGKDFGSMNMDELLKNIWTAEETQSMTPISNFDISRRNLQKQGSLTLPRTLSQKRVDEVWRELHKENGGHGVHDGCKDVGLTKEPNLQPQMRQPVMGEMTLQEFLQRAGVASESNQIQPIESGFDFGFKNPDQNQGFCQEAVVTESRNGVRSKPQKILPKQGACFSFNLNGQMGSPVNGVSIIRKSDESIIGKTDSNLDTSPSPPSYAYGGEGESKRSGTLEKVVERRRKRMIKNRESAARSRARKQAYTLELEAEVAKLKELNHQLQKKQEEIMESQKFQMPEKMKLYGSKRLCLRRTLTGPW